MFETKTNMANVFKLSFMTKEFLHTNTHKMAVFLASAAAMIYNDSLSEYFCHILHPFTVITVLRST